MEVLTLATQLTHRQLLMHLQGYSMFIGNKLLRVWYFSEYWCGIAYCLHSNQLCLFDFVGEYLLREAMLSAVFAVVVCLCVCVCLTHSGILSKWLYVGSRKQRRKIAPWF